MFFILIKTLKEKNEDSLLLIPFSFSHMTPWSNSWWKCGNNAPRGGVGEGVPRSRIPQGGSLTRIFWVRVGRGWEQEEQRQQHPLPEQLLSARRCAKPHLHPHTNPEECDHSFFFNEETKSVRESESCPG